MAAAMTARWCAVVLAVLLVAASCCDARQRQLWGPAVKAVGEKGVGNDADLCKSLVRRNWTLTLEDNFSEGLNTSRWEVRQNQTHCEPCEPQLYLSKNVYVANGSLVLKTDRERVVGPGGQVFNFTSGWVDTKERWYQRFGRFEINASLPDRRSTGIWPAFWLMPNPSTASPVDVCWPVGGEIDVFEYTANPFVDAVFATFRWGPSCGDDKQPLPGSMYPPEFRAGSVDFTEFHTYAVEWNETTMAFFVDDECYHVKTANEVSIPQDPFYLILDTAVAWYFPPGPDALYPVYHVIDYVRAYK
ncbi:hypothetical protein PTSG_07675 [Salpingoeca rosetta]|uniref:GH16 domain-containing protein n=1 Tax=Salpingoeca rosetta (strain ATCC 50818 / BSB-021) TaxID=946362 RepID=F2UHG1_SALR5|nr:uncharacterized protein PTSG_07675 [Salpingoeca rosetta]EGD76560.1 hypothetical protein PTSG_07675 [Salpingoeca rosetta]|eukprot:XP_004991474.1 hypothetical protein PTSG_07675 [Salpingoeca rosetta]